MLLTSSGRPTINAKLEVCFLTILILALSMPTIAASANKTKPAVRFGGAYIEISGLPISEVVHESSPQFDIIRDASLKAISHSTRVDKCCDFPLKNASKWVRIHFREAYFVKTFDPGVQVQTLEIRWITSLLSTIILNGKLEYQVSNNHEAMKQINHWSNNKGSRLADSNTHKRDMRRARQN